MCLEITFLFRNIVGEPQILTESWQIYTTTVIDVTSSNVYFYFINK